MTGARAAATRRRARDDALCNAGGARATRKRGPSPAVVWRGGGLFVDRHASSDSVAVMTSLSTWESEDAWEAMRADPAYARAMEKLSAVFESAPQGECVTSSAFTV